MLWVVLEVLLQDRLLGRLLGRLWKLRTWPPIAVRLLGERRVH